MLVDEQYRHNPDAHLADRPELQRVDQGQQARQHGAMQEPRNQQRAGYAQPSRQAEQAGFGIELVILAGVDDIEAGRPEGDGGGKPKNADIERSAHGDPGGGGRDPQGESQNQVRKGGEALGKRISEDDAQRDRGQAEAQRVQLARGQDEDQRRNYDETPREARREQPGGDVAQPGARIAGVDVGVDEAVERHGGRARPDHRDHDPAQLAPQLSAAKTAVTDGQQRPGQRERQREDRVLELDHFERETNSFPHKKLSAISYQLSARPGTNPGWPLTGDSCDSSMIPADS